MTILHDSVCTCNLCYSLYKLSHEYDIKKLLIFIYITKNTKIVSNRNIIISQNKNISKNDVAVLILHVYFMRHNLKPQFRTLCSNEQLIRTLII